FDVAEPVAERKRNLLRGRASGLANVVAADTDGVEIRHFVAAELNDVGRKTQAGARRVNVCAARDELLQQVVLQCAAKFAPGYVLLVGLDQIEGQQAGRAGVDG